VATGFGPDGVWRPSEYPWGPFVATYSIMSSQTAVVEDWIDSVVNYDDPYDYMYAQVYLDIPAVRVANPFGLPVMDCYSAKLYYSLPTNRFTIRYSEVRYTGLNCGIGMPVPAN
jgi:hypothetical protein